MYVDGYIYALAANREIQLRGVISAAAHDPSTDENTCVVAERKAWVNAARDAGFANIPDPVEGIRGAALVRPPSGVIEQTQRIGSKGSDLIVSEARSASADRPLLVIAGGAVSTLADAYLADPTLAERVVVSWQAAMTSADVGDYNGMSDPWATEITLRKFRVFVFPVQLDSRDPCRTHAQGFPGQRPAPLVARVGHVQPRFRCRWTGRDRTQVAQLCPQLERRSSAGGLTMVPDPAGRLLIMAKGDSAAGGEEFFRALKRAFAGGR